jgi:hypothetical protein
MTKVRVRNLMLFLSTAQLVPRWMSPTWKDLASRQRHRLLARRPGASVHEFSREDRLNFFDQLVRRSVMWRLDEDL